MIRINGKDLKTSKPSDLDEQLVAATGCSSKEIDRLVFAGPHLAAAALRPFLEDGALPGGELAGAIAADRDAPAAIAKLYATAAPTPDASKSESK